MRVGIKAAELVQAGDFGKMAALVGTEVTGVDIVEATATLKVVPPAFLELLKVARK